ncbi:hypothetical protein ACH4TV_18140 [Streptomyces sp. NPDC020898]|uniref:hypothetical protein n=1 Tax=Streptomyces sp. NPDC020898 TaxID=3365101 RepID=UPI00379C3C9C
MVPPPGRVPPGVGEATGVRDAAGLSLAPGTSLPPELSGAPESVWPGVRGGAVEVAVPISPSSPAPLDDGTGETLVDLLPPPRAASSPSVPKAAAATATAPITNSPDTRTPSETAIPPPPDVIAPTAVDGGRGPHIIGPLAAPRKVLRPIAHL